MYVYFLSILMDDDMTHVVVSCVLTMTWIHPGMCFNIHMTRHQKIKRLTLEGCQLNPKICEENFFFITEAF